MIVAIAIKFSLAKAQRRKEGYLFWLKAIALIFVLYYIFTLNFLK